VSRLTGTLQAPHWPTDPRTTVASEIGILLRLRSPFDPIRKIGQDHGPTHLVHPGLRNPL
jgi:hypothetical protein